VVVGGVSGSGKSTVARLLAGRLGAPYVELDAHYHRAGWREATRDEFRESVAAATEGERWVVDGNYAAVRDLVWPRATTFVWLDYPRHVATLRTLRRTARRLLTREELWNGNRERWRDVLSAEHPIRWSWSQHGPRRADYEHAVAQWPHLDVVRLRSPGETARWLYYTAAR